MSESLKTDLQACHMSLYPTMDSLAEAVQYIEAQAPFEQADLFPLLMLYHNSLLKQIDLHLEFPTSPESSNSYTLIIQSNGSRAAADTLAQLIADMGRESRLLPGMQITDLALHNIIRAFLNPESPS